MEITWWIWTVVDHRKQSRSSIVTSEWEIIYEQRKWILTIDWQHDFSVEWEIKSFIWKVNFVLTDLVEWRNHSYLLFCREVNSEICKSRSRTIKILTIESWLSEEELRRYEFLKKNFRVLTTEQRELLDSLEKRKLEYLYWRKEQFQTAINTSKWIETWELELF